jgi:hypothetical protein
VPLCTGEEAAGAAYLGVVFAFRLLLGVPDAALLELVELLLELLDPQPASSISAEQAITTTGRPLLIGTILSRRTLRSA